MERDVNNSEQRRVLPEKYRGFVGRTRFAVEYTARAASLVVRTAVQGYNSPVLARPPEINKV